MRITKPVPGNQETYTLYTQGYDDYFGKGAHGPGGFYSFDLGSWHLIALNSQICKDSTWNPDLGQQTPITKNRAIPEGCGRPAARCRSGRRRTSRCTRRRARSRSCTIHCSATSPGRTASSSISSSRSGSSWTTPAWTSS
ncbi:MAG TPA: hypothetical protein VEC15_05875 [Actinomycetota bacterium]|nr:hypothetical protein [Actinomycetota bacterium]